MSKIRKVSNISSWKEADTTFERPILEANSCSECGENVFYDENRGLIVCENCGLVHTEKYIDRGPEWRAFDADQKKKRTRTGAPMTYMIHDKGLSTMIDWKNRDIYGKEIPAKLRGQIYRLRKWQSRIRVSDATERNLTFALSELDRMASNLDLQKNLRECSAKIYRDAVEKHLIRGRSIEGVAAASLYAACRMYKVPRTLNEIADIARVDKKEIGRSFRFISKELKLNLNPTKASDFLTRFISELELSAKCQKMAKKILLMAEQRGLTSGRGPTGVCAAAIYAASILAKERRTQRKIARISQVTEVTVRNRFSELIENLKLPLNN
ncbi:MAG: transcription initiation factor IIB [Candidatus Lokiarchaeota archaeon]|nr:transcription initiation factor IIB [Candidatus Lokiarchaeota archaeon]MBD3199916.1 transcription initiation factor IIB [Candidatus Lokiarchaeota archaeon]